MTPESLRLFFISSGLIFLLLVSGCITPHALDLAEKKSSPTVTYTDWNLKKVRSAIERENGDISVYIDIHESYKHKVPLCGIDRRYRK